MINVKSEKGFYFTNPQDYLDGKINDLNSTRYGIFGVQTHDDVWRDETSGWGMNSAHFLGKNGIAMTKEEISDKLLTPLELDQLAEAICEATNK